MIDQRSEMLSLTDMWRAARAKLVADKKDPSEIDNRKPFEWVRSKGARIFIDHLETVTGKFRSALLQAEAGGPSGGGTWAHWQIGLAYAKYLSPEFHMCCNTVARERMGAGRRVPKSGRGTWIGLMTGHRPGGVRSI